MDSKNYSNFDNFGIKKLEDDPLNRIFVVLLVCLVIVGNIFMGCEIDLGIVYQTIKKPTALLVGAFTQFVVMPLLAYVLSYAILVANSSHMFALGLFVTGCSPSGSASNFWTILLDGNASLSVTMTFFSMLGSLVTMPFWMNLFGYKFLKHLHGSTSVAVPYAKIVFSLIGLIVPLLIGTLIAKFKPNIASKAKKVIRPFLIVVVIFVLIFGVITNLFLLKLITWPALLAGLLLPWCGFMFGCFTSILLRQDPRDVTAIAIETGVQNTGIAIMLLKLSFNDVDAGAGMLLPIIVACFTPGPLLLGYAVHSGIKRFKDRKKNKITRGNHNKVIPDQEMQILNLTN